MKLNGLGFARDNLDLPTPIGNISKIVEVVRKDVSSLQYLLTRLVSL